MRRVELLALTSLVVALATPLSTATPVLASVSAESSFLMPAPSGFKTTEISKTTIGVTWQPVLDAPKYGVSYQSASMVKPSYVSTDGTSFDIRNLTPNTTYELKVHVVGADGKTDMSNWTSAISAKTNEAPLLAPIANPLKVSSFNVKCDSCSTAPELSWEERRGAVVDQVKSEMPDVIGFQEATQGWLKDENGTQINLSQFEDLQRRLVAAGTNYQLSNSHRNNCENSATWVSCVYKDQGASQGTKIMYNASTLELVNQGSLRLPYIGDTQNQRYAAWAVLRQKSSGKTFFFVNTHLEHKQDTPEFQALKLQESQAIVDLIKEKNTANLPVFIVGDMNSHKRTSFGNVPWDTFAKAGYLDPLGNDYKSTYPSGKAFAENMINEEYDSFNGSNIALTKEATPGAISRHIDYIYSTPMRVTEWEMVLNKDVNDNLVGIVPSDHNMIVETVELPASVSPLAAKAVQLNGLLGAVTGSEVYNSTGAYQRYEKGFVLWSPESGAHTSAGPIRSAFAASGYESGPLGYPTTDEKSGASEGATYQMYQNGAIDYHPTYGAHWTSGPIRSAWLRAGGSAGVLGYPKGDPITNADGSSYQIFQNGAIDWSATTGAYATYGDIRARWLANGQKSGALGYPTGDVVTTATGSYQRFQNGFIVASPATGAHTSMGPIRSRWAATGYETGTLGYPTGEIVTNSTGSYQRYEKGYILHSNATGAWTSMGPIRNVYATVGYEGGRLGYPTSNVYTTATGTAQNYAGGTISISSSGVSTITYK